MFKTILKAVALSATTLTPARLWRDGCSQSFSLLRRTMGKIAVLSCGLFILTNCGTLAECLALGDRADDRPSCDGITGVGGLDASAHSIGGPVASLQGTAIYDGAYSLTGSNRLDAKTSFNVNFDNRTIATNNSSVNINGSFTEGGVLTGKFSIENDGIAPANINGMVGDIGLWANFDSRSNNSNGYLGNLYATREGHDYGDVPYRDPDIDYEIDPSTCYGGQCLLSAEELRVAEVQYIETHSDYEVAFRAVDGDAHTTEDVKAYVTRSASEYLERSIINASRSAEQTRWREEELWRNKQEPVTTASHAVSVSVASVTPIKFGIGTSSATKTPAKFSLVLGENDTAIATINDVEYEVIPDTSRGGGYISDPDRKVSNNRVTIFSRGSKRILKGTHPTVQGDYFEYRANTEGLDYYDSGNYITGFATMGIQTDASVVEAQTAVAIYRGYGSMQTYQDLGNSYSYRLGRGTGLAINMSVDFDANTIEGIGRRTESDFPATDSQPRFLDKIVTFNSTPIVGNGFDGTFTMNSELRDSYGLTDNPTGQYKGNFFGPNADDLAGVMEFNGVATDDNVFAIGGFRADRTVIQGFKE